MTARDDFSFPEGPGIDPHLLPRTRVAVLASRALHVWVTGALGRGLPSHVLFLSINSFRERYCFFFLISHCHESFKGSENVCWMKLSWVGSGQQVYHRRRINMFILGLWSVEGGLGGKSEEHRLFFTLFHWTMFSWEGYSAEPIVSVTLRNPGRRWRACPEMFWRSGQLFSVVALPRSEKMISTQMDRTQLFSAWSGALSSLFPKPSFPLGHVKFLTHPGPAMLRKGVKTRCI